MQVEDEDLVRSSGGALVAEAAALWALLLGFIAIAVSVKGCGP